MQMSDFKGFKDSFLKSNSQSGTNSAVSGSGSESISPPQDSKDKGLNIPSIHVKTESADKLASKSLDIKKQLSQSFQGNSSTQQHGGISKPQSRKNPIIAIKSNNASEDEDDDDKDDPQVNERKRRDNINEKIQELLTLIPAEFFQENPPATNQPQQQQTQQSENDAAIAAAVKNSGTKDGKPNKGQILTKSVEYLQYLQNLIDENNRKEVELVMKLKNLEFQEQNRQQNVPINVGHTSAERSLGKIGVGPLSDDYFKLVLVNSAGTNKSGQRKGSTFSVSP